MSTQAPQVLSRKANGTPNGATDEATPASKQQPKGGKAANDGNQTTKPAKGRGAGDRRGDSAKQTAHDGEQVTKPSRSKAHNEGEKLVIRRLPPGMTRDEFVSILGSDWEVSKGKVDWFSYAQGKVSTDPAKPSRPSRAYIHLMRKDDIMPLSDAVRNSTWEDAKATFTNPALIGPPALEFCVYKKVPGAKRRADARQGTIDQDPEFMGFLEALANPAPMRESIDVEDPDEAAKTDTKVTTTPLVEYLKEKKANKGKDGKSKSGKGKGGKDDESSKKKGKESKGNKSDKPSKESVKILTKKAAATEQAAEGAKKAASQIAAANAGASAADAPKSRRAGIAAAARILQRDLGLSPGSAHRRARHDAAKADVDAKAGKDTTTTGGDGTASTTEAAVTDAPAAAASSSQGSKATRSESPASTQKDKASGRRTRGGKDKTKVASTEAATSTQPTAANPPVILKKKTTTTEAAEPENKASDSQTSAATPAPATNSGKANTAQSGKEPKEKGSGKQSSQKKQPNISANATRAFVKHVNVSQGANDAALREALGAFGTITLVEIDKRKGFAYVDFAEHDGLVKAANASPVQVGQCSVQVLERKDKKPAAAATNGEKGEKGEKGDKGDKGDKNEKNEKSEKSAGGRGKRGRGGKAGGGVGATTSAAAAATSTTAQSTADAAPAATSGG